MALWVRSAVRALRLWGRGGEPTWARRHRIVGGGTPTACSAGVSSAFGNGGAGKEEKLCLRDIAELIGAQARQRVVVMAGAGISTASGIPDFRSPESGFYSTLQHWDVPYPEAIFELSFFLDNPRPFFTWAKNMFPGNFKPNVIHYFLRLLHDRGLLQRLYTQNIDGLERASGIPGSKLVEAHGSFASATCTACGKPSPEQDFWSPSKSSPFAVKHLRRGFLHRSKRFLNLFVLMPLSASAIFWFYLFHLGKTFPLEPKKSSLRAAVMADRVPRCAACAGLVKPDVVFFGEALPERFFLHLVDFPTAELLLILGTSLKVEPFASLSEAVRSSVPRVFMNRKAVESLRPRSRDVVQLGDLVDSVERLVELLGWTEEMRDLVQRETSKLSRPDR
ncbi:NAD-dependent protein deacetylase sirtuin-3, mitochondrial isoform X2 [Artibeus jamaicensis]|uniref:NAD-dependent protein deacetylase sirtuin-3, mitochondrial isoform X2 n=1 Tax=Artibeus jamaicensis TaxID=9417 RepID=UPI00235A4EF8|nr:NAD-dependent protein deacetylase sirtuin-3, mitochondrial isoform X2 [Artibeus jamaicensis]